MIVEFIRIYRKRFGVEPICKTLTAHGIAIAPSTFYAHQTRGFGPSDTELIEAYDAHRIYTLWEGNRRVDFVIGPSIPGCSDLGYGQKRFQQWPDGCRDTGQHYHCC